MELHERLKMARIGAGFATAKDAASRVGIPYGTYSGHEAGSRGIKREELELYARVYNVSLSWLAFGLEDQGSNEFGYAVLAGKVTPTGEIEFVPETISETEVTMPPLPIGKGQLLQIVLKVDGNALSGFAPNGSYIYVDGSNNMQTSTLSDMIDECLNLPSFCRLKSSERSIYKSRCIIGILRKDLSGSFAIERYLLPTILGADIEVAMPIIGVIMPKSGDRMRAAAAAESAATSVPAKGWSIPSF